MPSQPDSVLSESSNNEAPQNKASQTVPDTREPDSDHEHLHSHIHDACCQRDDGITGSAEQLLAHAALFWPDAYEVNGCLFLFDEPSSEEWQDLHVGCDGDLTSMEALWNHQHPALYFAEGHLPSREQLLWLCERLQSIWQYRLQAGFPHLDIEVSLYTGDADEPEITLEEFQLTVYQRRQES